MRFELSLVRRLATFLVLAFWLGGLTFYGAIVVPVGTQVLGGAVAQGFVTQKVTERLNVVGLIALTIVAWNAFGSPRAKQRKLGLLVTWAVMLVAQLALFAIHPLLDGLLDINARIVVDHARFYALHRVYLLVTMAQWIAGLAHFVLALLDFAPSVTLSE